MENLSKEIIALLIMSQIILVVNYVYHYITYLSSNYRKFKYYQEYSCGELSGFLLVIFFLERIVLLGWLVYETIFYIIK